MSSKEKDMPEKAFTDITAEELAARLASGQDTYILDVREPMEVARYALDSAVNIPMSQLGNRVNEIPRDREVVVVCASGGRSEVVAQVLGENGWQTLNLRGGLESWVASQQ